jgi:tRNA/rRNA methyltransferase
MNRCRVVLVGTQIAANVGSVARVMRNFGCTDLMLVAPQCDPRTEQARATATHHAEQLIESCRVVASLDDALADCVLVAGTSARTGGLFRRQTVGAPDEIAAHLVQAMAAGPVALVFGPERTGLDNDDVQRCHHLITIPADESYPALNLAQAAAVCVYEVRKAWLKGGPTAAPAEIATHAMQAGTFGRLREALRRARYLSDDERGEALMHALRHLIGRGGPSPMELRLLDGLARQIEWVLRFARLPDETEQGSQP